MLNETFSVIFKHRVPNSFHSDDFFRGFIETIETKVDLPLQYGAM